VARDAWPRDQRITHAAASDLNIHHAIAGAGKVKEIKHGNHLFALAFPKKSRPIMGSARQSNAI
jgi:hypothetical protein